MAAVLLCSILWAARRIHRLVAEGQIGLAEAQPAAAQQALTCLEEAAQTAWEALESQRNWSAWFALEVLEAASVSASPALALLAPRHRKTSLPPSSTLQAPS